MPIPLPRLDHLEKAVAKQLEEGRKMVEAVAATATVDTKKRARAYGELGQLYHAYELTDAARACYRNATALDPTCFDWNYALGYLLQFNGDFTGARGYYDRAMAGLSREPGGDEAGEKARRYLLLIRMGECFRQLNRRAGARECFGAAHQLNPTGPAVLARLGEIALENKQYREAIQFLTSALEKQPDANKLHYPLAMAYRGIGLNDVARRHLALSGMVGVQPPDPLKTRLESLITGYRVHLLAGRLAFSAGRFTEAAESFEKAVGADPDKPAARINLGVTLVKLGQFKAATEHFRVAGEADPNNMTVHFNLGTLYAFLGDDDGAIKHLRVVVAKEPGDAGAHFNLADAYQRKKQFNEALGHYRRATALNPGLTAAWLNMSAMLARAGQYRKAMRVLEEAAARLPREPKITHALARMLAVSPGPGKKRADENQGQRALDLAQKVFQIRQSSEHARTVALALARLGRCEKAVEWMEKAIIAAYDEKRSGTDIRGLEHNLAYLKAHRPCKIIEPTR